MSIDLDQKVSTQPSIAFQLKGGMFTLTTLQILSDDLNTLKQQLLSKIQQAPSFFKGAPIVLEIKTANQPNFSFDFIGLKKILTELNLIPIGIKNLPEQYAQLASLSGLATLRDNQQNKEPEPVIQTNPDVVVKSPITKIITTPVRSGQQIYAPDGDLIIVNSVSNGAELIADGNIHVYGALRGRALAGINGNNQARIFCKSLEAELISIAGNYKISEDIEKHAWKIAAQIFIKDDRLQINEL